MVGFWVGTSPWSSIQILLNSAAGNPGYSYTDDLLALDWCEQPAVHVPVLSRIFTHLNIEAWMPMLVQHPNQRLANYIVARLWSGFRFEANKSKPIHPTSHNLPSAQLHRRVVTEYLEIERRRGQMLGPFAHEALAQAYLQTNRIEVIPKGKSGKWRLITNLSYPLGRLVSTMP